MNSRSLRLPEAMTLVLAVTVVALLATTSWAASKEQLLHAFNGHDGGGPEASLVFDAAGNLYGTATGGGTFGFGTVFKLTRGTNGKWSETVLHNFESTDGQYPYCGLVFDAAGNMYGTTHYGGANGYGTVYKMAFANGKWSHSVLHSFNSADGDGPDGLLVFDAAGNLYGTTYYGGANNSGTIFELSPEKNGQWTETVLHTFDFRQGGANPYAGLVFDAAGNLYGTTYGGGTRSNICVNGCGEVFELGRGTHGQWSYTTPYSFTDTGNAGSYPYGGVVLDAAGNLYGTTSQGGVGGGGTVFKLTRGTHGKWTESELHSFNGKDGYGPTTGLVFDAAGDLFGTTAGDFAHNDGTVFKLAPGANHKWTQTVLHSFSGKDGSIPSSDLIFDHAGKLYGVASSGGNSSACAGGCGVVFAITP
jgi:uncharacterized repeat protein (TIGR03803 family)